MSRDFIASQQGREFKKSPNRDRIVRGTVQRPVGIFLEVTIPVVNEFVNTFNGEPSGLTGTGVFYKSIRFEREVLVGPNTGAKLIERTTWNESDNSQSTQLIRRDAGFIDVGGVRSIRYVSPTELWWYGDVVLHKLFLEGPSFPYREFIDYARSILNTLVTYPESSPYGDKLRFLYYWYTNPETKPVDGQGSVQDGIYLHHMPMIFGYSNKSIQIASASGNITPLARKTVILKKIRSNVTPRTKWVIRARANQLVGVSPDMTIFQEEISCSHGPFQSTVFEPEWSALDARAWIPADHLITIPFGPERWAYTATDDITGLAQPAGPGSFPFRGFTVKPTCDPNVS